jgi:hypothetical protein
MRAFVLAGGVVVAGCGRVGFSELDDASLDPVRMTLALDRVAPGETLLDFPLPVLLDATRADLSRLTPENLRAFDASGTELPIEIETAGPPFTAWIRVPAITGMSTTVTLEYGGPARTLSTTVWDSSYLAVWHMSPDGKDSSPFARPANAINLTGMTGDIGVASLYGGAAAGSCLVVPSFRSLALGPSTILAHGRFTTAPTDYFFTALTRQKDDTAVDDFYLGIDPQSHPIGAISTGTGGSPSIASPMTAAVGVSHTLQYTFAGQSSSFFVDGVRVGMGPAGGTPSTSDRPVMIGCGRNISVVPIDVPDGDWWDGFIDEVRVENVARSDAWIVYTASALRDAVITYRP